jgi:hypothetical protein
MLGCPMSAAEVGIHGRGAPHVPRFAAVEDDEGGGEGPYEAPRHTMDPVVVDAGEGKILLVSPLPPPSPINFVVLFPIYASD